MSLLVKSGDRYFEEISDAELERCETTAVAIGEDPGTVVAIRIIGDTIASATGKPHRRNMTRSGPDAQKPMELLKQAKYLRWCLSRAFKSERGSLCQGRPSRGLRVTGSFADASTPDDSTRRAARGGRRSCPRHPASRESQRIVSRSARVHGKRRSLLARFGNGCWRPATRWLRGRDARRCRAAASWGSNAGTAQTVGCARALSAAPRPISTSSQHRADPRLQPGCPYCFKGQTQAINNDRLMTGDEDARQVLGSVDGMKSLTVSWFGGEPLLGLRTSTIEPG